MRAFFFISGLVIAGFVGGAWYLQTQVDWNAEKPRLIAALSNLTGYNVALDGPVYLELLPSPRFSAAHVSLTSADGGEEMQIGLMRADLRLFSLLRGVVDVSSLRMRETTWRLNVRAGVPDLIAPEADGDGDLGSSAALAVRDLVIDGGELVIEGLDEPFRVPVQSAIVEQARPGAPIEFAGAVGIGSELVAIDGRAEIGRGRLVPLQASLSWSASQTALRLNGWVRPAETAEAPLELGGRLTARGDDLGLFLNELGVSAVSEIATLALPFEASAALRREPPLLQLVDLVVRVAGQELRGTGSVGVSPQLTLRTDLRALAMDADALQAAGLAAVPAPAVRAALPEGVRASASIAIDRLMIGGKSVRGVAGQLRLQDGALHIADARATLPGKTAASLDGTLLVEHGQGRFDGIAAVRAADARQALSWFGIPTEGVPFDRLRGLALESSFSLSRNVRRFDTIEGRIDDVAFSAALSVEMAQRQPGVPSTPTRLALEADFGPLQLGAYRIARTNLDGMLDVIARSVGQASLAVTTPRIEIDGEAWQDVAINARIEDGAVRFNRIALTLPEAGSVSLEAESVLAGGSPDGLRGTVEGADVGRVLARIEPALPDWMSRLGGGRLAAEFAAADGGRQLQAKGALDGVPAALQLDVTRGGVRRAGVEAGVPIVADAAVARGLPAYFPEVLGGLALERGRVLVGQAREAGGARAGGIRVEGADNSGRGPSAVLEVAAGDGKHYVGSVRFDRVAMRADAPAAALGCALDGEAAVRLEQDAIVAKGLGVICEGFALTGDVRLGAPFHSAAVEIGEATIEVSDPMRSALLLRDPDRLASLLAWFDRAETLMLRGDLALAAPGGQSSAATTGDIVLRADSARIAGDRVRLSPLLGGAAEFNFRVLRGLRTPRVRAEGGLRDVELAGFPAMIGLPLQVVGRGSISGRIAARAVEPDALAASVQAMAAFELPEGEVSGPVARLAREVAPDILADGGALAVRGGNGEVSITGGTGLLRATLPLEGGASVELTLGWETPVFGTGAPVAEGFLRVVPGASPPGGTDARTAERPLVPKSSRIGGPLAQPRLEVSAAPTLPLR